MFIYYFQFYLFREKLNISFTGTQSFVYDGGQFVDSSDKTRGSPD